MGVVRITHPGQHSFLNSAESAPIDGDPRKCADNRLRRRAKLMRTLCTITIKIFLHHQLAALIKQHAVYVLEGAIEDPAYNRICRHGSQVRPCDISYVEPV